MKNSIIVKATLILSGLIAFGVGSAILIAPHSFHASAGLMLGDDVNLLNEVRAPGGMLLALGLFILFGAFRSAMIFPAMVVSTTVYLSYGLSRVVSLIFDGFPNNAMLQIMALELAIGGLCFILLNTHKSSDRQRLGSAA